jgi:hypothetical protein
VILHSQKHSTVQRDLLEFLDRDAATFKFEDYYMGEQHILKPALERRGYTHVQFYMIEQDSFGPLIRGCKARNSDGNTEMFYYG